MTSAKGAYFALISMLLLFGCSTQQSSAPAPDRSRAKIEPSEQIFRTYSPDYLTWFRNNGLRTLSETYGVSESRFDKAAVLCLAEYERSVLPTWITDRLDAAARQEITMTYRDFGNLLGEFYRTWDREGAKRKCGYPDTISTIDAN
jgi:hypothetical protein